MRSKFLLQRINQPGVNFHGNQPGRCLNELFGQDAAARTDFNYRIAVLYIQGVDDLRGIPALYEKTLAQTFLGGRK